MEACGPNEPRQGRSFGAAGPQTPPRIKEVELNTPIIDKVVEQLKDLPQELQWRVLEFTRTLAISTPKGVPGQQLLRFSGIISPDDAQMMREAIEQGCERIDTTRE